MSTLPLARETISDRWESLVPSRDPSVGYRRLGNPARVGGVIPRRAFYFDAPEGGAINEVGPTLALIEYRFNGIVRLALLGRTLGEMFDEIGAESIALMNAVNFAAGNEWPEGVRYVYATGFRTQPTDSDDVEIIIAFVALCEES